jgi:hypothetical protein
MFAAAIKELNGDIKEAWLLTSAQIMMCDINFKEQRMEIWNPRNPVRIGFLHTLFKDDAWPLTLPDFTKEHLHVYHALRRRHHLSHQDAIAQISAASPEDRSIWPEEQHLQAELAAKLDFLGKHYDKGVRGFHLKELPYNQFKMFAEHVEKHGMQGADAYKYVREHFDALHQKQQARINAKIHCVLRAAREYHEAAQDAPEPVAAARP